MCGIIGYVGKNDNAIDMAIQGLKRLEYRGYDSAGIAAFVPGMPSGKDFSVFLEKTQGKVIALEKAVNISRNGHRSSVIIAHTRWATHGMPSVKNAHPHTDCTKQIYAVHNGIIENYAHLKEVLEKEGHTFCSETDTEVIVHLIERHLGEFTKLEDAVLDAICHLKGTFALAVINKKEPNKIVVARRSSPLIVGLANHGYFLASDASAITEHTKKVIYLDEEELAVITPDSLNFFDFKRNGKKKKVDTIDWNIEQAEKGGYPKHMIREICQQPGTIVDSLRGRLVGKEGRAKLGGLEVLNGRVDNIKRFVITSCGTSYYAGLIGKYLFENIAGIPTEVDLASELRYRGTLFQKDTALLILSQSGETADSLAALKLAKNKGCLTLGIVNTVGSSIARGTDAGVYNHIGPEICVASTKAFTSQLSILTLFALFFGRKNGLKKEKGQEIIKELYLLPSRIKKVLCSEYKIEELARKYKAYKNFLFLGRNYNYPVALEGALKLKEVSYAHAEGYAAGEMKHGPIALIDENFPTIAITGPKSSPTYGKVISNLQEIKARKGPIIAIAEEGDNDIAKTADDVFYVPKIMEAVSPIINVVPLQLFAYHMALQLGRDIDQPRNLAKSVTVE